MPTTQFADELLFMVPFGGQCVACIGPAEAQQIATASLILSRATRTLEAAARTDRPGDEASLVKTGGEPRAICPPTRRVHNDMVGSDPFGNDRSCQ